VQLREGCVGASLSRLKCVLALRWPLQIWGMLGERRPSTFVGWGLSSSDFSGSRAFHYDSIGRAIGENRTRLVKQVLRLVCQLCHESLTWGRRWECRVRGGHR